MGEVTNEDALYLFAIYDKPTDFPESFVVRRWAVTPMHPEPQPDPEPWGVCATLEHARQRIPAGLVRMHRMADDAPSVVETWF